MSFAAHNTSMGKDPLLAKYKEFKHKDFEVRPFVINFYERGKLKSHEYCPTPLSFVRGRKRYVGYLLVDNVRRLVGYLQETMTDRAIRRIFVKIVGYARVPQSGIDMPTNRYSTKIDMQYRDLPETLTYLLAEEGHNMNDHFIDVLRSRMPYQKKRAAIAESLQGIGLLLRALHATSHYHQDFTRHHVVYYKDVHDCRLIDVAEGRLNEILPLDRDHTAEWDKERCFGKMFSKKLLHPDMHPVVEMLSKDEAVRVAFEEGYAQDLRF